MGARADPMTVGFIVVVLFGLFLYGLAKSPGEVVQLLLAAVWILMGVGALGSIAWAILSR
jgi:hypothetical protein